MTFIRYSVLLSLFFRRLSMVIVVQHVAPPPPELSLPNQSLKGVIIKKVSENEMTRMFFLFSKLKSVRVDDGSVVRMDGSRDTFGFVPTFIVEQVGGAPTGQSTPWFSCWLMAVEEKEMGTELNFS
ncbi:hypothetical protein CAEBREN_11956 [Caenorhabditis brenneri]|uniref:Uncharacterized protein n=1 Tax=Caenorhabditis brenneri TaxID=135651 RepID=G0MXT1_CAEBE|nr:hypothetical protein CAEBREN_11956 [Caenorhabditis brenneri]